VDSLDTPLPSTARPAESAARRFDGIAGLAGVKQRLGSIALAPTAAAWAGLEGVTRPGGILLHGPAGPAIESLAAALAGELAVPLDQVDLGSWDGTVPGDGVGVVLLTGLDEFLAAGRSTTRRLAEALDSLRDRGDRTRPLVVTTSNAPWDIPVELFDGGRLDRLVFVPPPDWSARHGQINDLGHAAGIDLSVRLDELTAATAGWTGDDLARLVRRIVEVGGTGTGLLDVVAEVGSTAAGWMEHARVMVNFWRDRGMVDDLVGYLRRIGAA